MTTSQTTSLPTLKAKVEVKRLRPQSRRPISECKATSKSKNKKGKWAGFTFFCSLEILAHALEARPLETRSQALPDHLGTWFSGAIRQ